MKKASLSVCGWVRNRFGQAGHAALRPHSCCSAAGTSGVKGMQLMSLIVAALTVIAFVGEAGAALATWNTTRPAATADYKSIVETGSFSYTNSAKWQGGVAPISVAGKIVSVEDRTSAATTTTVDGDITVGEFYSRSANVDVYVNKGTGGGKIIFDNGANPANFYVHSASTRFTSLRNGFNVDIELKSNLNVFNGSARQYEAAVGYLGGIINGDGKLTLNLAQNESANNCFFKFGASGANTYKGGTLVRHVGQTTYGTGNGVQAAVQIAVKSTGAFGLGNVTFDATGCNYSYVGQLSSGRGMWIRFDADNAFASTSTVTITTASLMAFDLNGKTQSVAGVTVDGTPVSVGIYKGGDMTWLFGTGSLVVGIPAALTVSPGSGPITSGGTVTVSAEAGKDDGKISAFSVSSGINGTWNVTGMALNDSVSAGGSKVATATLSGLANLLNGAQVNGSFGITVAGKSALPGATVNTLSAPQSFSYTLSGSVSGNAGPSGTAQTAVVANGGSFAGLNTTDQSGVGTHAGFNTRIDFLAGTAGAQRTLSATYVSTHAGSAGAKSDVVTVTGIGGDKFVFQMKYDASLYTSEGDARIVLWSGSAWINAVAANQGVNDPQLIGDSAWAGDTTLGHYGVDTANDVVWAVLDDSGDFAAGVPLSGAVPPLLSTPTVTAIDSMAARLGATVTADGGSAVTLYGTTWGTSTLPEGNRLDIAGNPGTLPFTQDRDSLPSATKIYARGWASNSVGIAFTPTEVTFYTEPTAATAASFDAVQATTMTVNWTSGNGDGRIVVMKQGSAVTHIPTDGTDYTASAAFRGGQNLGDDEFVVYKGTGSSVPVTGLTRDTTYHVAVYEYIADGAERNYQQDTPAAASQKTSTSVPVLTLTTANTIDMTTATLSATINDDGADTITSYGTVWGTESQPTANEQDIVATPSPLPYVFTQSRDSLPSATLIYARGWASNSVGIAYSLETSFYTEPSAASNVSFSLVTNNSMTVSWDNGGNVGRIVVMKQGGAVAGTPSDGTNYTANAVFHSGSTIAAGEYVVYAGSGSSVTVTNLGRGTTYHVAVFEYAGSSTLINYQQDAPATGSQATVLVPMDFTYDGTDNVDMDWDQPTNYVGDVGFPDKPGDKLIISFASQAHAHKMNGNKTLSGFLKRPVEIGATANTGITGGSVPTSVLTWDTGVAGSNAMFFVRAGNSVADLRCYTAVDMVLNSSLVWDGSTQRDFDDTANQNAYIKGNISGVGKLTVKWNKTKTDLYGTTPPKPMYLVIYGGTGPNTHLGGTEFQTNNLGTRAGFYLNKQHATGDGPTTVGSHADIYLGTNVVATGGAIRDSTSLYLQTDGTNYAKVELASGVDETVDALYLWNTVKGVYDMQTPGTYGSSTSGAKYAKDNWFSVSGTGILRVKNGPPVGTLVRFF